MANAKRKALNHETRRAVILRDKCTCQKCGKVGESANRGGKPAVAEFFTERARRHESNELSCFHFHHIIPVFLGGSDEPDNLELRCQKCNSHEKFTNMMQNYLETLGDKTPVLQNITGD